MSAWLKPSVGRHSVTLLSTPDWTGCVLKFLELSFLLEFLVIILLGVLERLNCESQRKEGRGGWVCL